MVNKLKNFIIGLFLMAGIGVFVGLVLFLHPSVGDEKQTIYVRFSNINKITIGTRVLFAGKAIGTVTAIDEIYHARATQPSDELGQLYFYQLTLKIDSNVHVYNTDEITLQTSGLLGEKAISIVPKTPPAGKPSEMLTDKTPFYADSVDPIENTFNRLSDIGEKLNDTVDLIKNWFEQNEANLSLAVSSFGSAMTQIETTIQAINQQQLVTTLQEGATALTSSLQKIDTALSTLAQERTFENLGTAVANIKVASHSFGQVCQDLAAGQGTLGRLLQSDDMYLRATAIMSKADTMMNDINHYGILFHLNKGWQRSRTKQLALLQACQTPGDFKTYFQTEVDQINTAMARLSLLVDTSHHIDGSTLLQDQMFQHNFAELLRKVQEMSDNLRLYNQQLTREPGA